MSEPTITPALTSEEWARWLKERAIARPVPMEPEDIAKYGQRHQTIQYGWPSAGFTLTNNRWGSQPCMEPDIDHALAALALHGQPFGFTREDVALLRSIGFIGWDDVAGAYDHVRSLAARIEALLPPDTQAEA